MYCNRSFWHLPRRLIGPLNIAGFRKEDRDRQKRRSHRGPAAIQGSEGAPGGLRRRERILTADLTNPYFTFVAPTIRFKVFVGESAWRVKSSPR